MPPFPDREFRESTCYVDSRIIHSSCIRKNYGIRVVHLTKLRAPELSNQRIRRNKADDAPITDSSFVMFSDIPPLIFILFSSSPLHQSFDWSVRWHIGDARTRRSSSSSFSEILKIILLFLPLVRGDTRASSNAAVFKKGNDHSRRILRGSMARGHMKKFLLYCLYAWGLSFLVSILAIVADWTDILPDYLQPDIGSRSCWFTRESAAKTHCLRWCNARTCQR